MHEGSSDSGAVAIPFSGSSDGASPLTWAQTEAWSWLSEDSELPAELRRNFDIACAVDLSPGMSPASCVGALGVIVGRHRALRTVYGRDEDGKPVQTALAEGSVPGRLIEPTTEGVAAATERLIRILTREPISLVGALPLRAGFVLTDGVVRTTVFVLSRLAADGWAVRRLAEEYRQLVPTVNGTDPTGPIAVAPAEEAAHHHTVQVGFEQSDRGRAVSRAALRYYRRTLGEVETPAIGGSAVLAHRRPSPDFHVATLESPLVPAATRVLTTAGRGSDTSLLLTAYLIALCDLLSVDRCFLKLHVSNRFTRQEQESVTRIKQCTVLSSGPMTGDFRTDAEQIFQRALRAYRHSRYDPEDLWRLIEEEQLTESENYLRTCTFNDRRPLSADGGRGKQTDTGTHAAELRAALRSERTPPKAQPAFPFHGHPLLSLTVDTQARADHLRVEGNLFSDRELVALLARTEDVLLAAAVTECDHAS
jgi:hypothetical protein